MLKNLMNLSMLVAALACSMNVSPAVAAENTPPAGFVALFNGTT